MPQNNHYHNKNIFQTASRYYFITTGRGSFLNFLTSKRLPTSDAIFFCSIRPI